MHKEAHDKFLDCVQVHLGICGERRSLLVSNFYNYRCDKGLKLSIEGIEAINQCTEYKWLEIELDRFIESRELTIIDNASKSPYYIKDKSLFISDDNMMVYHSLSDNFDQFLIMIQNNF